MEEHKHHEHQPPSGQAPASPVKHVWCDDGAAEGDAPQLGHIVRTAYTVEGENGPETKSDVYVNGNVYAMAYREPGDRDAGGSGLTFWNIVTDVEGSNR